MIEKIEKESATTAAAPANETEPIFHKPATTVITDYELKKIKRKLQYLQNLIGSENLGNNEKNRHLLAQFILLNPHDIFYKTQLDNLLEQVGTKSPLTDNIVLAQTMLTSDMVLRVQKLDEAAKNFAGTDGGIQAKFELACLKLAIWKEHNLSKAEKEKYLTEAKAGLERFLKDHPNSIFAEQAREKLATLPVK
jgi:hypothetical protein